MGKKFHVDNILLELNILLIWWLHGGLTFKHNNIRNLILFNPANDIVKTTCQLLSELPPTKIHSKITNVKLIDWGIQKLIHQRQENQRIFFISHFQLHLKIKVKCKWTANRGASCTFSSTNFAHLFLSKHYAK